VTSFQYAQETIFLQLFSAVSFGARCAGLFFKILKRGVAPCSPARFVGIMSTAHEKALALSRKIKTPKVGIQFRHR